jgi:hypothetical protein
MSLTSDATGGAENNITIATTGIGENPMTRIVSSMARNGRPGRRIMIRLYETPANSKLFRTASVGCVTTPQRRPSSVRTDNRIGARKARKRADHSLLSTRQSIGSMKLYAAVQHTAAAVIPQAAMET